MKFSKRNFLVFSILLILLICSFASFAGTDTVNLDIPYKSYTFDYWGDTMPSPLPYLPERVLSFSSNPGDKLKSPQDLYVGQDNRVYIADTGNNRIVILNSNLEISNIIKGFINNKQEDKFNQPSGIFVDDFNNIYVADRGNQRVVELNNNGKLVRVFAYPVPEEEGILPEDFSFKPTKVVADESGRLFVLSEDVYEGILQYDNLGNFQGFIGAPKVTVSILDRIWKYISTDQQENRMARELPTEYYNMDIDYRGFIYATVSSSNNDSGETIRKLNPSGEDVLRRNGFYPPIGDVWYPDSESDASITGPSQLVDITIQGYGVYSALDRNRGRVFTYDNDGDLLFVFGYNTEKTGALSYPTAIDFLGDKLLIIDAEKNWLNVYAPTDYASSILAAIKYHYNGKYDKSTEMWKRVLKYNVNYDLAYTGIGRAFLRQDEYKKAMENFRLGNNRDDYSEALGLYRRVVIGKNFGLVVTIIIILLILNSIYKRLIRPSIKKETAAVIEEKNQNKYIEKVKDTLEKVRYSLYVVFHPFDGFWDLKNEKRGSTGAAIIILILVCLTYVFMRQYTGFVFNELNPNRLNILMEFSSVIVPLLLWCIVNWSLTTLVEGKGSFKDIFITTSYALTPIILVNIPMTIFSNFITVEEGAFYKILVATALIWAAMLVFFGIMVTHRFELKKNFFTTVITIAGMIFIIFLSVLFFNLIEQVYTFVSEIYHEVIFRL